ncbi:MAG: hypothetical protein JEZ11_02145 [Desulfobacterales bacterium]|nr:hypothetical protein [Desulfobacterales bacterium]
MFAVLVVLAVIIGAGALNFHIIVLSGDVKILKKAELTFTDTFVDARGIKRAKLYLKPNLVRAGIKDVLGN